MRSSSSSLVAAPRCSFCRCLSSSSLSFASCAALRRASSPWRKRRHSPRARSCGDLRSALSATRPNSAPCLTSTVATSRFWLAHAQCRGVLLLLSTSSHLPSLASNNCAARPVLATCSAVSPRSDSRFRFASAPAASNSSSSCSAVLSGVSATACTATPAHVERLPARMPSSGAHCVALSHGPWNMSARSSGRSVGCAWAATRRFAPCASSRPASSSQRSTLDASASHSAVRPALSWTSTKGSCLPLAPSTSSAASTSPLSTAACSAAAHTRCCAAAEGA
mmetsp:Transcript_25073/g.59753  ORF Transcript_25073/g.59753 Transcript_25073/m.59753 type:complete len:280 (-) Transcript_25073:110-949(-)